MTSFNKFFKKSSRVISNDKFLSSFMRQTSHIKPSVIPLKINKVSPLKLKHLFSAESQRSDSQQDEMYLIEIIAFFIKPSFSGKLIISQIEEPNLFSIENGVVSRHNFQLFNILELSCLVFSLMGLGFAIISVYFL